MRMQLEFVLCLAYLALALVAGDLEAQHRDENWVDSACSAPHSPCSSHQYDVVEMAEEMGLDEARFEDSLGEDHEEKMAVGKRRPSIVFRLIGGFVLSCYAKKGHVAGNRILNPLEVILAPLIAMIQVMTTVQEHKGTICAASVAQFDSLIKVIHDSTMSVVTSKDPTAVGADTVADALASLNDLTVSQAFNFLPAIFAQLEASKTVGAFIPGASGLPSRLSLGKLRHALEIVIVLALNEYGDISLARLMQSLQSQYSSLTGKQAPLLSTDIMGQYHGRWIEGFLCQIGMSHEKFAKRLQSVCYSQLPKALPWVTSIADTILTKSPMKCRFVIGVVDLGLKAMGLALPAQIEPVCSLIKAYDIHHSQLKGFVLPKSYQVSFLDLGSIFIEEVDEVFVEKPGVV